MAQNIVVGIFEVESEGFQALAELKQNPGGEDSFLTAAALVKKENGALRTLDAFDTGVHTTDDTALGGLLGALVGVLGGPIGVLLGGSYGMLLGSTLDMGDAVAGASLLEQTAMKMDEGDVAVIGLAFEEDEKVLDQKLGKYKTIIARFDAATIAAEVEEAEQLEKEMARQARQELRDEKKAARKERRAEKKQKLSADWEAFKAKFRE